MSNQQQLLTILSECVKFTINCQKLKLHLGTDLKNFEIETFINIKVIQTGNYNLI